MTTHKYIIIGAGSAGCALANRLSEKSTNTILLIEAGPAKKIANISMPLGASSLFKNKKYGWCYDSKNEPNLNNRSINTPRGKVLGGSSATNGMVYIRGQQADFNNWESQGCAGWGYSDLLNYFRGIENNQRLTDQYHGNFGDVWVDDIKYNLDISNDFINAAIDRGIPRNNDFNGPIQEGVGFYQVNIKNGQRFSSYDAFIKPILKRKNLTIISNAHVKKIILSGNRAIGVDVQINNKSKSYMASNEVILSAGTINSPKILNLSGIGTKEQLKKLNIDTHIHNKNIGQNLQDHLTVNIAYGLDDAKTFTEHMSPAQMLLNLYKYTFYKKGLLTYPAADVGVFFKTDSKLENPDAQIHFAPGAGEYDKSGKMKPRSGITASVCFLRPTSKGHISLRTSNYLDNPIIHYNYLDSDLDKETMIKAFKITRDIFSSKVFNKYNPRHIFPSQHLNSDLEILNFIKETALSVYHPVGTCKMGIDEFSVVDSRLKMYGVQNLRIADASIIPTIISGNTNAICNVIGAKCADLITEDHPS
tara:strand:+ start:21155 stop:22753 length:1599 start_codon:yes stop_codon:yes gene_type:complete